MTVQTDLQRAYTVLNRKKITYDLLWRYYDGDHPLKYSSKKLAQIFSGIEARFTENWVTVVVDAVNDRLDLENLFVEGDDEVTALLESIVDRNELTAQADAVHLDMQVTGEGYFMIWQNDGSCQIEYNDSRLVHLFYDPECPSQPLFGCKWWEDITTGRSRMTLYYADRLEYYESKKSAAKLSGEDAWKDYQPFEGHGVTPMGGQLPNVVENPFGMIPVVQFRRELRTIQGEITASVIDLQDTINKLMNDMMVASEYGAFKQRYIISNADDLDTLENGPGKIWDLAAGDGIDQGTQVGEFSETRLENFTTAMEGRAASMGRITNTPISYFDLGKRADPSGEALIAMEGPLIKKVNKIIKRLRSPWRRLATMALALEKAEVEPSRIKINYADPRTIQPLTQAQARQANTTAGIPLSTQLAYEGWTSGELAQLNADKRAEQEADAESLAQAMMAQQRNFDGGVDG